MAEDGSPSGLLASFRRYAYATLTAGYFVTLLAFCWDTNITSVLSFNLLLLAAIPLLGLVGQLKRPLRSWLALVMIALSYEVIAGPIDAIVDSSGVLSLSNVDRSLWGFNFTGWVQSTFASAVTTDVASLVYLGLVPIILGSALLIWRRSKADFGKFVSALVLTSYSALLTFILVPTAPPWFSGVATNLVGASGPHGVVGAFAPMASLAVPDYFASFPSLHVAYTITCAFFLYKMYGRVGLVGAALAGATLFSTLYLGQHFAIDLIGGAAYSLIPCLIVTRLRYPTTSKAGSGTWAQPK